MLASHVGRSLYKFVSVRLRSSVAPAYRLVQDLLAAKRDFDLPRQLRKPESTEGIPRRRSDEGCGVRAWVGEDRMPVKWTMGSVAATPGDVCGPW